MPSSNLLLTLLFFAFSPAELVEKFGSSITSSDICSYAMYPKVFEEFKEFTLKYGDLSTLPTRYFLSKPPVGEEIVRPTFPSLSQLRMCRF